MEGLILDCLGGSYTVETEEGTLTCKARGVFRKNGISPCAGDRCEVKDGIIDSICERKNSIIRPPLANIDVMIFVISTCEPSPDTMLLDKFIAVCEYKGIEPAVALTKNDLATNEYIPAVYSAVGIPVFVCDYQDSTSTEPIKELINGKVCAFTGNTGVGKSTLLNFIAPALELETAHISKKLGRGRHTTRVSRLYKLFGGYIADTPGFSSFDFLQYARVTRQELKYCFREFEQYEGKCRFADCSHTKEKDCAVLEAVESGAVARSRHKSYLQMYEEAGSIKEWENRRS